MQELLALRVKQLWAYFVTQDFTFWATCAYLVVEYVRPQQLIPALSGAPLGQIVVGLALVARIFSGKFFTFRGPASRLLMVFTGVILASSLTAFNPSDSVDAWRLWFSWVFIYFLIASVVNTKERFLIFILVWMGCHYYMSQGGARQLAGRGFAFEQYGVRGAPGWFENSGEFGIAMCMFFPIAWHFYLGTRRYLNKTRMALVLGMPVTAGLSILGSSSRGALLGLAAVALWSLLLTRHRVRAIIGIAVLGCAMWLLMPPEFTQRFSNVGDDYTSQTRITFWKAGLAMARANPVLGIGYGNWLSYYDQF
ncbi:MAG: hypothetical protein JWM95_893, partial [Gemmatimonadetes bacterium]|nr:hypothetical protein [Gemmatimonadota bacterium]